MFYHIYTIGTCLSYSVTLALFLFWLQCFITSEKRFHSTPHQSDYCRPDVMNQHVSKINDTFLCGFYLWLDHSSRWLPKWNVQLHCWVIKTSDIGFTNHSNPIRAKYFKKNMNIYLHFFVTAPHWHDTGSCNPLYLFYIVNIMSADGLATIGARTSATMIFTILNRID